MLPPLHTYMYTRYTVRYMYSIHVRSEFPTLFSGARAPDGRTHKYGACTPVPRCSLTVLGVSSGRPAAPSRRSFRCRDRMGGR